MSAPASQNLLSAQHGAHRVTIGHEAIDLLRGLSDTRALTCPGCSAPVILRAGSVRAAHFAHLPGAICTLPQTEPETEEHRAGKLLLADWLRARLPGCDVIVEAFVPETQQRADLLLLVSEQGQRIRQGIPSLPAPGSQAGLIIQNRIAKSESSAPQAARRIALEFQCANLSAREWRRRHGLYRAAGIEDLWLLGGSRLHTERAESGAADTACAATEGGSAVPASASPPRCALRTSELERALLWEGAPLLFLDAAGERFAEGTLARFRPDDNAQALHPTGRLSGRPLQELAFPWALLDWATQTHPDAPLPSVSPGLEARNTKAQNPHSDWWLWEWLAIRYRVTPETLDDFFGANVRGQEAFACELRVWQAAIYYRFLHRRVGDSWWLPEIETWVRAYLPLARPANPRRLQTALAGWQEILAAAGLLSLPVGYNRTSARVQADLTTLAVPLDQAEVLKLAAYRRTLLRDARESYRTKSL